MTEAEWLACTDPAPMLALLRGKVSDRKLRLFTCACGQRYWHLLAENTADRGSRILDAADVGERLADGLVPDDERATAEADAHDCLMESGAGWAGLEYELIGLAYASVLADASQSAAEAIQYSCNAAYEAALHTAYEEAGEDINSDAIPSVATKVEEVVLCRLLRDIAGYPSRSVPIASEWLAWNDGTVLRIAQSVYDDRRFQDMPLLAGALEDAGCDNADLLGHCRSEGPHVRGCWAVDLLLGRS